MHTTAYLTAKYFFDTYCIENNLSIVEIGSQNVNGSLRDHANKSSSYVGIDFSAGLGVDVILDDPYKYPYEDNTFDILVTSSCFEHSEMFWLSFLEGMRILKPNGIMYCNVPSNRMVYHRYPVDCWRFMPDAAKGLCAWGNHNNIDVAVLESFIVCPIENSDSSCYDWCSVFIKDKKYMDKYPIRMIDNIQLKYVNGFKFYNDTGDWNTPINRNNMA